MTEFFNGIKPFALEEVEIAPAVSSVFAVKNEEEKERMRRAGNTCRRLMKNVFVPEMEAILRSSRKVKHSKIADKVCIRSLVHRSWRRRWATRSDWASSTPRRCWTFATSPSSSRAASTV